MEIQFTTDFESVLNKIDKLAPLKYGKTRNYVDGDVTYLSPYISRGVISTKQVLEGVLSKGIKISQIECFVKELCWRDYFQRVGQTRDLHQDIKQPQQPILNYEIPSSIINAANSSKKYFANQENINKYTNQRNTFLDKSFEDLEQMAVPDRLLATQKLVLQTVLPQSNLLQLNNSLPTFIYNYYNLDPNWQNNVKGNRILLLEPDFFEAYPISKNCIEFMLALSKNIPNMQVYVGSFKSLKNQIQSSTIYYKEHPLNLGYLGIEEPRDWITETIIGYFPSFFSYWKKVEKQLILKYN